MDNFFPKDDYKLPETSNYFKFKDGDNKFRILSSAIIGYEYFNIDKKPVRSKELFESTPDIGKDSQVKHFWAFVVYNYQAKRVQVLELTQKGIMQYIQNLVKNPKWGNPMKYDIVVNRVGAGLDTEYTTVAEPHSEIDSTIKKQYESMTIDLNQLYKGGDPFAK